MLYASEGLTFGLRPNALGLRTGLHSKEPCENVNLFFRTSENQERLFVSVSFFALRYTQIMRILLQKVTRASVHVAGEAVGTIGRGYLLFLCVLKGDTAEDAAFLAHKITSLRLWEGESGTINDRSILDVGGEILVVSQFTLAGESAKGNRPDYTAAADPETARKLYEQFQQLLRERGVAHVASGRFGAHMLVDLQNDGPVTLLLHRP